MINELRYSQGTLKGCIFLMRALVKFETLHLGITRQRRNLLRIAINEIKERIQKIEAHLCELNESRAIASDKK
jgi:hypothetical protein